MALPEHQKAQPGLGKVALKRFASKRLPHDLVYRPKQGFGAPVSEWFKGELGVKAQQQIKTSSLAQRDLIDYGFVDKLWDQHRAGGEWSFQLWNLYNVSVWHDYWVAGRSLDS